MSSRVLTPDVVGIDALVHDHQTVLAKAEGGVVAVFANNAPAFYAVTPARLAELLALEEKLARPGSDVALDDQLYQEPQAVPVAVPMGKFAMYPDWQPDTDFIRQAALWGVALESRWPPKNWRHSLPTGRRKAKSFTMCSGNKNWRAACKSVVPATADCRNEM